MNRVVLVVALAVVFGAALLFLLLRRPPTPGSPTAEGTLLVPISPVGLQERIPEEIRWRTVDGASTYDIEILDERMAPVWNGEARAGRLPFPSEIVSRFESRETLYYRIRARGGFFRREIAVSEPVFFRKSAGPPS